MVATLTAVEPVTAERRITADELCRLYAQDVCRFAAMMSTSASDADDLAQEALLRAVRALSSYNPARGPMVAWLWRILSNAAKDAAGRRQRVRDLVIRIGVVTPRGLGNRRGPGHHPDPGRRTSCPAAAPGTA